jgi:hypothetical protein
MRGTRGPQLRVDMRQRKPIAPAPNATLILECYCACRWHQRCRFAKSGDFGASPFCGQNSEKLVCMLDMGRLRVAYKSRAVGRDAS